MNEPTGPDADFDLTRCLDVVARRRWVVLSSFLIVAVSILLIGLTRRPVYQASTLLLIEKERGGTGVFANGGMVENSNDDYYQTQYRLLQSRSLAQRVYVELGLAQTEEFRGPEGLQIFERALSISPVLRSRLVNVRAESGDPALAARIANAVCEAFVGENVSNQLFISKDILQALQARAEDPQSRRVLESLPAVVSNPLIQSLKGEYARLDARAAEMSQRYTERYPAMIALRSNVAALKRQIRGETDKLLRSIETELSGQLKGNNVRIVDPARVPAQPIRPNRRLVLLLSLFTGLAFGVAAAFLVETLDHSIRSEEDVERELDLPFLGMLPAALVPAGKTVFAPLLSREPSLTSEAFRNLRTMVGFAAAGGDGGKAFLVTSSIQDEGKTYTASNTAVAFAQLGERVLLIEGDLRRSHLHVNFGLSCARGVSDFLASGQSADELPALLQSVPEVPGLSVLVCGTRPPNPSELLNTPRLSALVAWARANFDRIIVDCPPVYPLNDTLLWGRHMRNCIYVVRYGKTRVPIVARACQKLEKSGTKILGVAVNASMVGEFTYTGYGYYGYRRYYREAPAGKA